MDVARRILCNVYTKTNRSCVDFEKKEFIGMEGRSKQEFCKVGLPCDNLCIKSEIKRNSQRKYVITILKVIKI